VARALDRGLAKVERPASEAPASVALLTPSERLSELADILAAGLQRMRARKSSGISPDSGESPLHFSGHQSGHADPHSRESEA
jgi:hypothetical protein